MRSVTFSEKQSLIKNTNVVNTKYAHKTILDALNTSIKPNIEVVSNNDKIDE